MAQIIAITARLVRAGKKAYTKKWSFLGVALLIFLGSVAFLAKLDLLPEMREAQAAPPAAQEQGVVVDARVQTRVTAAQLPVRIEIPAIGLSAVIENPTTTEITVLDRLLLAGAVRYPTSARLGEEGNIVLFGHSSYLPVVGNQAYKTFNGIQKLSARDTITIYAADTAYTYTVRRVARESAVGNAGIPLSAAGKVLTLVTCNSFGAKEDRFVVTADFVSQEADSVLPKADFVESRAISG